MPTVTYYITEQLQQQSYDAAHAIGEFMLTNYVRRSARLLNQATDRGFARNTTELVTPSGKFVPLPRIATPDATELSKRNRVSMPQDEYAALREQADKSKTTVDERILRSLRFANYIIEECGAGLAVFEHKGERIAFPSM